MVEGFLLTSPDGQQVLLMPSWLSSRAYSRTILLQVRRRQGFPAPPFGFLTFHCIIFAAVCGVSLLTTVKVTEGVPRFGLASPWTVLPLALAQAAQ